MAKVVRGDMFFEDDIKIIDAELDATLNLPTLPILSRDELQVLYNGRIFIASDNPSDEKYIKVYTEKFGLQEIDTSRVQEDKYFSDNAERFRKMKESFIEKVVNGISANSKIPQLSAELVDRIRKKYVITNLPEQTKAGKRIIVPITDGSIFSQISGYERVLMLDKKIYDLKTIPEYISIFEESFDKKFYKEAMLIAGEKTPEEISKSLIENKDKIHRKVLSKVRNKIWHSERSFKLYLDGTYWIPDYRENAQKLNTLYYKLLERDIKIDAAGGIKWIKKEEELEHF